jgi:hypothetical protein
VATEHPSPLFIVGSPRSGTSILVTALRRAAYRGFNEGNFLGLLDHINRIVNNYFATFWTDNPDVMMSKIDKEELKAALYLPFKYVVDRENPVAPWLDKTGNPEAIRMIPALLALWPSAHFIFAKRRGIENVKSRMGKFQGYTFEYHCMDWAANMSTWREIRKSRPDLKFIEVEQRDMIVNPEDVAAQLAGFLRLSPEQQAKMATTFRDERPQRTGRTTAEQVFSLASTGWNQWEHELFLKHCSQEMELYGYTLDESYKSQVFSLKAGFTI